MTKSKNNLSSSMERCSDWLEKNQSSTNIATKIQSLQTKNFMTKCSRSSSRNSLGRKSSQTKSIKAMIGSEKANRRCHKTLLIAALSTISLSMSMPLKRSFTRSSIAVSVITTISPPLIWLRRHSIYCRRTSSTTQKSQYRVESQQQQSECTKPMSETKTEKACKAKVS